MWHRAAINGMGWALVGIEHLTPVDGANNVTQLTSDDLTRASGKLLAWPRHRPKLFSIHQHIQHLMMDFTMDEHIPK